MTTLAHNFSWFKLKLICFGNFCLIGFVWKVSLDRFSLVLSNWGCSHIWYQIWCCLDIWCWLDMWCPLQIWCHLFIFEILFIFEVILINISGHLYIWGHRYIWGCLKNWGHHYIWAYLPSTLSAFQIPLAAAFLFYLFGPALLED